jgi:hypothetical protein
VAPVSTSVDKTSTTVKSDKVDASTLENLKEGPIKKLDFIDLLAEGEKEVKTLKVDSTIEVNRNGSIQTTKTHTSVDRSDKKNPEYHILVEGTSDEAAKEFYVVGSLHSDTARAWALEGDSWTLTEIDSIAEYVPTSSPIYDIWSKDTYTIKGVTYKGKKDNLYQFDIDVDLELGNLDSVTATVLMDSKGRGARQSIKMTGGKDSLDMRTTQLEFNEPAVMPKV